MTTREKTAEQLIVEKHTACLRRGFHLWPELKQGRPPALGDYRWPADLILSTWLQAETGNSCAGINRPEVENTRVSRERDSDPLGPEFCAGHREVHGEA